MFVIDENGDEIGVITYNVGFKLEPHKPEKKLLHSKNLSEYKKKILKKRIKENKINKYRSN